MSDILSNFFSHLKNSQNSRILVTGYPQSKIIMSVLNILQECGYIRGYRLSFNEPHSVYLGTQDTSKSYKITKILSDKQEKSADARCASSQGSIHCININNLGQNQIINARASEQSEARAQSLKSGAPSLAGARAPQIEILLKYKNQTPAIKKIIRVSKPSKRIYISVDELSHKLTKKTSNNVQMSSSENLSPLLFMKGILLLSTSKGIMTHLTAYRLNIGGEVLCHIS